MSFRLGTMGRSRWPKAPPFASLLDLDPRRYALEGLDVVLMEVPFTGSADLLLALAEHVEAAGLTPLIAHPERTEAVLRRPALAVDLAERGWPLQVNSTSLLGRHGPERQELGWWLLRDGLAQVVASDGHRETRPARLDDAYELALAELGPRARFLFDGSALEVPKSRRPASRAPARAGGSPPRRSPRGTAPGLAASRAAARRGSSSGAAPRCGRASGSSAPCPRARVRRPGGSTKSHRSRTCSRGASRTSRPRGSGPASPPGSGRGTEGPGCGSSSRSRRRGGDSTGSSAASPPRRRARSASRARPPALRSGARGGRPRAGRAGARRSSSRRRAAARAAAGAARAPSPRRPRSRAGRAPGRARRSRAGRADGARGTRRGRPGGSSRWALRTR